MEDWLFHDFYWFKRNNVKLGMTITLKSAKNFSNRLKKVKKKKKQKNSFGQSYRVASRQCWDGIICPIFPINPSVIVFKGIHTFR